jgi:hypothetical protein
MQKVQPRNRRKHKRSIITETAEYSAISSPCNEFGYGIISDMSETGVCLLTTTPLKCGEKIVLKSGNAASKIAVVLWSDIGAYFYKAGLKLL